MPDSSKNQLGRRDFIKATVATIGSLIGALIGIPSIVHLLSPSLQAEKIRTRSISARLKTIRLESQPVSTSPAQK